MLAVAYLLLPLVVVPYLSGLAADTSGRVASDAAYLFAIFAAHFAAILLAAASLPRDDGFTQVLETRGVSVGAQAVNRAAGFCAWSLIVSFSVAVGAALAARQAGAADWSRVFLPPLAALSTFGFALFVASLAPKNVAIILAVVMVLVGHLLDVDGAALRPAALLLPAYAVHDAWPGTVVSAGDFLRSGGLSLLYSAAATGAAVAILSLRRR